MTVSLPAAVQCVYLVEPRTHYPMRPLLQNRIQTFMSYSFSILWCAAALFCSFPRWVQAMAPQHPSPETEEVASYTALASFKISAPEGGERGQLYLDANLITQRSGLLLPIGRHYLGVRRGGHRLVGALVNGRYVVAESEQIPLDVTHALREVRVVFFLEKK